MRPCMTPTTRRLLIALAAVLLLGVTLLVALHFAVRPLQHAIEGALGPRASIGAVEVGWSGVTLHDLRIRADPEARGNARWPADDELRAARVHVSPDLASLWAGVLRQGAWRVRRIEVEDGQVSLLRTREGRLRVLPALLEQPTDNATHNDKPATGGAAAPVSLHIGNVALRDVAVDFFDASVRQPAHHLRLEELRADIGPLDLPALDTPAQVALDAVFKGPQRNGRLSLKGTLTPATRDATLQADVRGVDLVALQPYLLKLNEGGVRRGTLDLTLQATTQAQHLHAPGRVTLSGVELGSGSGLVGSFAGVPRQAVMAAMARDGRIVVNFTLDGRLDDPAFSINDNLATQVAGGLAEALGVSLGGVVKGMGNVIKGLFGR